MSLTKNTFYTTIIQMPVVLLNIIAGIFITRLLGPEGKGVWAIFQAGLELFVLLFGLGMQTGIIYFISSGKMSMNKIFGLSLFIAAISIILNAVVLGAAVFTNSIQLLFPEGYTEIFFLIWFLFSFALKMYTTIIYAMFQAETKFRTINTINLLNALLYLTIFGALFATWHGTEYMDVKKLLIIVAAIYSVLTAVWTVLLAKRLKSKPDFNFNFKNDLKPFLTFNLIAYGANLLQLFNYRLDLWIVEHFNGITKVGIYSLAVNIANFFLVISGPISSVLYSYFSKGESKENKEALAFFSRINFTIVLLLCIAGFFAAIIIPFIYGIEFKGSIMPFKILIPGFLFLCASKTFSAYLTANNQTKYNLLASGVGVLTTLILDLLLIPSYGIIGAALASSVAYIVMFGIIYFYCFTALTIPRANYFIADWSDIKKMNNMIRQ